MLWNIEGVVKTGYYNYAIVPEHPNAIEYGYVLEHRIVMENFIGRILTSDEVVHHIDKNTHNNRIENLQLMTVSEHNKMHGEERQVHGSYSRYRRGGCRCDLCRKINAEKARQYRARRKERRMSQ